MHAQYAMPCLPEYYPAASSSSSSPSSMNNPYLAHDDGHAQNYTDGFSTGSTFTYPHQEYRYILDRGEVDFRLCTPSLVDSGLDATGLGFAGNPSASTSAFEPQPEEITAYQHQQPAWGWMDPGPSAAPDHEIVAPAPMYPAGSAEAPFYGGKPSSVAQAQAHENGSANASANAVAAHPPAVHPHAHANQEPPLGHVPLPVQAPGAAQLPTPAAMAVLLSPEGRSAREPVQTGYGIIPPSSAPASSRTTSAVVLGLHDSSHGDSASNATHSAAAATRAIRGMEPHTAVATQQGLPMIPDSITREKKHACTMCHKRFDRPSTLRKHLLVHTGEKAFVCDTCGRRFGVASNLNRHVKRCILKPVNSPSPSNKPAQDVAAEAAALVSSVTGSSIHMSTANKISNARRARGPSTTNSPSSSSASGDFNSSSALSSPSSSSRASGSQRPPGQKRRRRAPSPSQWIPHTLQRFNLHSDDFYSICAPLLPVVYDPPLEERGAYGENISPTPYHPCGWNGVLPGPGSPHSGLGGKDVRNYSFGGGRGEYMYGRIQLVC